MAFSKNQNQLMIWGQYYLGDNIEINAKNSLKYWIKTHQRMMDLKSKMQERMYIMSYDSLCENPKLEINNLLKFLGVKSNFIKLWRLSKLISPPQTIGRYKNYSLDEFDKEDLDYVRKLGHLD